MQSFEDQLAADFASEDSGVAYAQWTCIALLHEKYRSKPIRDSENNFEDDVWRCTGARSMAIYWSSIDPNGDKAALVCFLKIAMYRHLESRRGSLNTVLGYINQLMQFFAEIFEKKKILLGRPGCLLMGFDEIDSSDIEAAFERRILQGRKIDQVSAFLSIFKQLPRSATDNLQIFTTRFNYPWAQNNFEVWQKIKFAELGSSMPEVRPFLAMLPETTRPLIERSMFVMENYADEIITTHDEARRLDTSSYTAFFKTDAGIRFANDRLQFFEESKSIKRNEKFTASRPVQRFELIVELLRAACINIILFTTGLRNGDVTLLRVGCCKSSGRVDMLYYVDAEIMKTDVRLQLPVPAQAKMAISILERLRWDDANPYVVAPKGMWTPSMRERSQAIVGPSSINAWLFRFADWFGIPFFPKERANQDYTAHCYRATVAGWLDSSSNLSILLVRRLFGHGSQLMPLAYLHHNPIFIKARKEAIETAANAMAQRMADAVAESRVAGSRGEELLAGYREHRDQCRSVSESLTDKELKTTFQERIKERISSGSMLAMMTPFGVICTRNPNDSSQPLCAKVSDQRKLREHGINQEIWDHLQSVPDPSRCVGKSCTHAMLGPWSIAIRDSLKWYIAFLEGSTGNTLSMEELRFEAKSFIKQYAGDIQKIYAQDAV